MSEAWKKLDLEGSGLQQLNLALAREMRKRPVAYALLALFPLGLHRFYLAEPKGGVAYLGISTATAALILTLGWPWPLAAVVPALVLAAYDLVWIDRRVTAFNKALRMRRFLKPGRRPPPEFKGRYTGDDTGLDDYVRQKESERAGHPPAGGNPDTPNPTRAPSFNEQEAMLRELARTNKGRKGK